MTTNYTYNTGSNQNKGAYYGESYARPEQYKTDEQLSDHSGSPEKLYQFIENKENAVQDLKGTATFQSRNVKEANLSPEKIRGTQPREYNIALKEKTNIMGNNNIPVVESQTLSKSQVLGQQEENIVYAPSSSLQRISTLNRASQVFQLNRNDIVISVTDPSRKGGMIKHTDYCIQGNDKEGEFKVTRSHDDFIKIRTVLVKRWPGCYVPSVPPKRVLTKVAPAFLEGRRKEFEMFVQKITELPHLHYSREYQRFLRAANLDEELATFQKVAYDDIILRYKTTFKQALQLTATPEAERKISEFKTFLQNIFSNFKRFKQVLKKTSATRQAYYEQLVEFHNIMSGGYEKDVLTKLETNFESKPVFDNTETGDMTERVSGIKQAGQMHSIEYLYAWIKAEAREIKAFLEAIEQKELYDEKRRKAFTRLSSTTNKLERTNAGKPGFVAMLSGKSRETQISTLQGKVLGEDKEAKQLQTLYDIIVLVLAHSEIDRFKVRKSEQYHNVVNLAAQYELSNLQNLVDYWSAIMSINPSRPSSISRIDTQ